MEKKKKGTYFKSFVNTVEISASYINRYRKIYIAVTLVVALFELVLAIRGLILFNFTKIRSVMYFVSYIVLLASSAYAATFLIIGLKKEQSKMSLNVMINAYSAILLAWAVLMSILDMVGNGYPIIYLTVLIVLASIVPINPSLFVPLTVVSGASLIVFNRFFGNPDALGDGDYINIGVFLIMSIFVAYRNYKVTENEENHKKELTRLSKVDVLTGLGNENSYYSFLDILTKKDGSKQKYAVMVLDLNGLKATDDTYGHRYGAFLVSEVGRILPTIFTKSALFHTGGDEFVVIILSEYDNLDELVKKLDETLAFTKVTYEGVELTLSVARGIARHKPGETYNETYQRADEDMYINKKEVKAKYNIIGR